MFFGGAPPAYLEGPIEFTVNTAEQPPTVDGQGNISGEWVAPGARVAGDFDVVLDGECVATSETSATLSLDISLDGAWTLECATCPPEPVPYETEHRVELPVKDGATFETMVVRYILHLY